MSCCKPFLALALCACIASSLLAQPPSDALEQPPINITPEEFALELSASIASSLLDQPPNDSSEQPPIDVTPDRGEQDPIPVTPDSPSLLNFDELPTGPTRNSGPIVQDHRHRTERTRQDITEKSAKTMVEALEGEVGVLMQRTGAGQASPFVRGLTGPQTVLLIDGIRLSNSTFRFGPNQYFATIDPSMVERIEVVRGPQSVLWGSDAIGGAINVITRSAEDKFLYDYHAGEFIQRFSTADRATYSRLNVEGSTSSLAVIGGAGYLNVRDLDRGGSLGIQPFTNYSQYSGDIKFDYLISHTQMLTISLQHVEQKDVPRSDKFPSEARIFSPQQRDLAYVRWQGVNPGGWFDSFMLTGSVHRQKTGTLRRRPPTSATEDRKEVDVVTTGISLLLSSDLDFLGSLTYGVDWYHDDVDASAVRFVGGVPTATLTPEFPDDSFYERIGVFLQWDVVLTDRLSALAGVRYTNIDAGATVTDFDTSVLPPTIVGTTSIRPTFQDWTSSIGLVYELNPYMNLVGSVAEGFRAPSLEDSVVFSDNVFGNNVDLPSLGLSPETSMNYEVGLKFDFPRLRGQTFVFWTEIQGLIERFPIGTSGGTTFNVRRNIGNARLQGAELAAEYLLTDFWSLYGNFAYILGNNITGGEPMRRIPPAQGIVGIRWRDPERRNWLDIYGWLVRRQSRLSSGDISDPRIPAGGTPGYGTLNLRIGSYITENQRLSLGLENILDKAYRVHGSGVDGSGISATFGYELFH